MEIFAAIGRFLYHLTLEYGVIGLAGGAFLESLGIPTASAVIDLTAGLLIINERTTFVEALIVSDAGLTAGSLASFYLGRMGSRVTKRSIAPRWLEKYGDKAVLFGQLFGPARTWISYPAGAIGMNVKKFTLYTALGGAVYCAAVITASLVLTDLIRARIPEIERLAKTARWLIPLVSAFLVFFWYAAKTRRSRTRGLTPLD